jgi:hypothetical protein
MSYKMGTGGSFPGVRQGREADHSPPTSAEVKKMWIYTSTPPYVFCTLKMEEKMFFQNRHILTRLHSVKLRKTLSAWGLVFVSCLFEFRTSSICCIGLVSFLNSLFAIPLATMRPAPFWAHLNTAFVLFNRLPTLWMFTELGAFDRVMLLCSTEYHCEDRSQWDRFLVPFALYSGVFGKCPICRKIKSNA